jgi:3-phosphoshikimate 1-carboxyvinyltransferase
LERESYPPVGVKGGGLGGGKITLSGKESSQYLSSLLLAAPYARNDLEVRVTKELVSRPYVDITLKVMENFGVRVERDQYRYFRVPAGSPYRAIRYSVEGDVSTASYFWAAAAVTGGEITTENIFPHTTPQGDIAFLDILESMGCRVYRGSDQVTVQGGELCGIEVDMKDLPDMVPTLASVALFARGRTMISNAAHLRFKESDRLSAIACEWKALGARVEEQKDGLVIHGREPLKGGLADPHGDHRLAMSLAVVGLKVPEVRIKDETCANKSFPEFWDLWNTLSHFR